MKIGINSGASALSDGQAVTLSLNRRALSSTQLKTSQITIPIAAAKILPTGPVVFTVSTSSPLVAHPIVLGTILGDQVVVVSGLTPDLSIVSDARGLSAGQSIIVGMGFGSSTESTSSAQ